MKSVIGLLEREADVEQTVDRLNSAGYQNDAIHILTHESSVQKLFGCDPVCVPSNYAAAGAAIGVSIYTVFAVFASFCECSLLGYGLAYGVGTILGGILAGAFVGGGLGLMVGVAESEKDTQFYVQGVRMGDRVISIQVDDEDVGRTKQMLRMEKASGVRVV